MSQQILPFDLTWGVDSAIKKLRPEAAYMLYNRQFMDYNDPTGLPPPTWEEIQEQIDKDKAAAEDWIKKYKSNI